MHSYTNLLRKPHDKEKWLYTRISSSRSGTREETWQWLNPQDLPRDFKVQAHSQTSECLVIFTAQSQPRCSATSPEYGPNVLRTGSCQCEEASSSNSGWLGCTAASGASIWLHSKGNTSKVPSIQNVECSPSFTVDPHVPQCPMSEGPNKIQTRASSAINR